MLKRQILFLLLLLLGLISIAQTSGKNFTLPRVIPNSPGAAAFARYGEVPVSVSTGVPNIAIPFFTITSGKLSLPISINYHAAGIKVLDEASAVGLGWSLQAGPKITRSVQGVDDFDARGFYNMIFPDPNDPHITQKENCLAGAITDPRQNTRSRLDGQPDMFYYSLNSKNGRFILKNRILKGLEPGFITLPYEPIQIKKVNNEFIITDDNGITYTFGSNQELAGDISSTTDISSGVFFGNIQTSWNIKKIQSADKADAITFNYVPYLRSTITKPQFTLIRTLHDLTPGAFYTTSQNSGAQNDVNEALISEINFRNGKITFEYTTNAEDIQLAKVRIYQKNNGVFTEIKQWIMGYSRFINTGAPGTTGDYAQLRLDNVQEKGLFGGQTETQPPHQFEYFSYQNFQSPPFNTKAQDFWGFFNGKTDNQNLLIVGMPPLNTQLPVSTPDKRKANEDYLRVGTLKKITYPTGGITTLDLEANQKLTTYYREQITRTVWGGDVIREAYIDYTPSIQFIAPSGLLVKNDGGGPYNATLDFSGSRMCTGWSGCIENYPGIYLRDLTTNQNVSTLIISELLSSNPNPPTSQVSRFANLFLTPGHTYQLTFQTPVPPVSGQQYRNSLIAYVSGEFEPVITQIPITETVLTGGLRIKKITTNDGFGNSLIKKYNYTQSYYNSQLFDGDFDKLALNSYKGEAWAHTAYGADPNGCVPWAPKSYSWSENLALPIGSVSNNSISYNEVEEIQEDVNGNTLGKTVFTYNQAYDELNPALPLYKVDQEMERGLLKTQKIFKANSTTPIKEIINNYADLNTVFPEKKEVVKFYTAHALIDNSIAYPDIGGGEGIGAHEGMFGCKMFDYNCKFRIDQYQYISSKSVLSSQETIDRTGTGDALSHTTTFEYNNPYFLQPSAVKERNSKNEEIKTTNRFPLDFQDAGCSNTAMAALLQGLNTLKTQHSNTIANLFDRFVYNRAPQPPACNPRSWDALLTIQAEYEAAQQNFDEITGTASQLIANYNSAIASYQSCVNGYYNAASSENKAIADLQRLNNIIVPLEVKEFNSNNLITTTKNVYATYGTDLTLPAMMQLGIRNNPLENKVQVYQYNLFGEPVDVSKSQDAHVSYIYDYYNAYPTAMVNNSTVGPIAYTSFEAEGNGSWYIAGSIVDEPNAPTGKKAAMVGNGILKGGLSPSVVYRVSYWSKNGMVTISGNITGNGFPKTGPVVNGWTYFEHRITGFNGATLSGGGLIDELRLYPEGAQMTTYTYEPLIGMTSECDANNRITYYEYDAFGRLSVVRDQNRKVIKKTEYKHRLQ
jgi:YD repeat-containing protein